MRECGKKGRGEGEQYTHTQCYSAPLFFHCSFQMLLFISFSRIIKKDVVGINKNQRTNSHHSAKKRIHKIPFCAP